MIFHNRHLAITDINEMGKYALGNLPGYENLPSLKGCVRILIAGDNFGSGSSRQQAVDCFKAIGIEALLMRSVGAIYKRNAINAALGLFIIEEGLEEILLLKDMEEISIDTVSGLIGKGDQTIGRIAIPSGVQMAILAAGGMFEYGKKIARRVDEDEG